MNDFEVHPIGTEIMSKWISVEDRLPLVDNEEVEIAFWDGCYMCRTFGAYEHSDNDWYVGQEPFLEPDWTVTHWRYPDALPEPPGGSPE